MTSGAEDIPLLRATAGLGIQDASQRPYLRPEH